MISLPYYRLKLSYPDPPTMNILNSKIVSSVSGPQKRSFKNASKRFGVPIAEAVLPSPQPVSIGDFVPVQDKFITEQQTTTRCGVEFRHSRGSRVDDKVHSKIRPDVKRCVRIEIPDDDGFDLPHTAIPSRSYRPRKSPLSTPSEVFVRDPCPLPFFEDTLFVSSAGCCDDISGEYIPPVLSPSPKLCAQFVKIDVPKMKVALVREPLHVKCEGFEDYPLTCLECGGSINARHIHATTGSKVCFDMISGAPVPREEIPCFSKYQRLFPSYGDHPVLAIGDLEMIPGLTSEDNFIIQDVFARSEISNSPFPVNFESYLSAFINPYPVDAPNFCDDCCDFMFICPHIVLKKFPVRSALQSFRDHFVAADLDGCDVSHLRTTRLDFIKALLGCSDFFSVWAAWRSYWFVSAHDDLLKSNIVWAERYARRQLSLRVNSEGLSEILSKVGGLAHAFSSFVLDIITSAGFNVKFAAESLIDCIMRAIKDTSISLGIVTGIMKYISLGVVYTTMAAKGPGKIRTLDDLIAILTSVIHMCIRYWMGYPTSFLMLEFALDSRLRTYVLTSAISSILSFSDVLSTYFSPEKPIPEGASDSFYTVLVTIFCALTITSANGMNLDATFLKQLMSNISTAGNAMSRIEIGSHISTLLSYCGVLTDKEREDIRLRTLYPAHYALADFFSSHHEDLTAQQSLDMRVLYTTYLNETKSPIPRGDRDLVSPIVAQALSYIRSNSLAPTNVTRKQPCAATFIGPPGMHKSHLCELLASALATKRCSLVPSTVVDDFIYHPNDMDAYSSGYRRSQDIWVFDDLLQRIDTEVQPCPSLQLWIKLVNTAPFTLNMADLADKAMVGSCNLVLASTNAHIESREWRSMKIKSIVDPDAFARRISHLIRVKPREPYHYVKKEKKIYCRVNGVDRAVSSFDDPHDMYYFEVTTGLGIALKAPSGSIDWTWAELLTEMWNAYSSCFSFVPPKISDNSSYAIIKDLPVKQEGIHDLFGWWKKKCACGLVAPTPCICEDVDKVAYPFKDSVYREELRYYVDGGFGDVVPVGEFCRVLSRTPCAGPSFLRIVEFDPSAYSHDCECVLRLPCLKHAVEAKVREKLLEPFGTVILGPDFGFFYERLYLPSDAKRWTTLQRVAFIGAICVAAVGGVSWFMRSKTDIESLTANPSDPKDLIEAHGHTFSYDETVAGFVSAEGRYETTVNGRRYVVVTLKNGTVKVYPQGYVEEEHASLFAPRVRDQLPVLWKNLFAVVSEQGNLLGNLLALDQRRFVGPAHVIRNLSQKDVTLCRDNERYPLTRSGYMTSYFDRGDMGILELQFDQVANLAITGVRKIVNKFMRAVPETGACSLAVRDHLGQLMLMHGTFSPSPNSIQYVDHGHLYNIDNNRCRVVTGVTTSVGYCGGVYLSREQGVTQFLVGTHVAALNGDRFAQLFDSESICRHESYLAPITNVDVEGDSCPGGVASAVGFACGRSEYPMPIVGKGRTTRLENVPRFGALYEPSVLQPALRKGVVGYPAINALSKLATRTRVPQADLKHLFTFVEALSKRFPLHPKPLRSWNDLVKGDILPSVDRGAVCGVPLNRIDPYKRVLFEDTEIPQLTPDAMLLLDRLESKICPEDWATRHYDDFEQYPAVNVMALKDEARLETKVDEFATRLYEVTPEHELLLQRKYFIDLAEHLVAQNLAYCSALGIDPADWTQFAEIMFEEVEKILAMDFWYMDGCFTPYVLAIIGAFMIGMYGNDPRGGRRVSPYLPPLDRNNYVRWVLLERMMFHVISVGPELFVPSRSHPSGSFLTTILNILWQIIMWHFLFCLWACKDDPVAAIPDVVRRYRLAFVGDDSLISARGHVPPVDWLISNAASLGFKITPSEDKKGVAEWFSPWVNGVSEFSFLSRFFANTGSTVVGLLSPDRLLKMPCFSSDYKKLTAVYPQVIENFVREFRLWNMAAPDALPTRKCRLLLEFIFPTIPLSFFLTAECHEILARVTSCVDNDRNFFAPARRPDVFCDTISVECEGETDLARNSSVLVSCEGPGDDKGKEEHVEEQGCIEYKVVTPPEDACASSTKVGNTAGFGSNMPNVIAQHNPFDPNWVCDGMPTEVISDGKVFSRPVLLASGDTGANVTDHVLEDFYLPYAYFNKNHLAREILFGASFLRCTVCVRLTGIVNPTVAGKFLLSMHPTQDPVDHVWQAASDLSLQLDASSANTVTLRYPTMLPCGWSRVDFFGGLDVNLYFNHVRVMLWILGTFSSVVRYTMHAWLEDVDMRMPGRSPLSIEGPPSTLREIVKSAFSGAKRGIKTFGGVVSDVAVMIDTAAKVAALAGLSAPPRPTNSMFMISAFHNPSEAQVYASVPSLKLALCQEQKTVQPMGVWNTAEDEMSVKYIASRPGIIALGLWDNLGLVHQIVVNPGSYLSVGAILHFSPLAWLTRFFQYWRGDLTLRIEFDGTPYHTGEYVIIYVPDRRAAFNVDAANYHQYHHRIVNLAMGMSYQWTIPFASPSVWSNCFSYSTAVPNVALESGDSMGFIFIRNLSALGSTGSFNVPSSINYRVWCWSDNIEFACPVQNALGAYTPVDPDDSRKRAAILKVNSEGGPWGDDVATGGACGDPNFLFPAKPCSMIGNASTIGEVVDNLRPLMRRFDLTAFNDAPGTTDRTYTDILYGDRVACISRMYSFWTGGVRFTIYANTPHDHIPPNVYRGIIRRFQHLEAGGYACNTWQHFVTEFGGTVTVDLPYSAPNPYAFMSALYTAKFLFWDVLDVHNATMSIITYAYGADDFTFGHFRAPQAIDPESWTFYDYNLPYIGYTAPP